MEAFDPDAYLSAKTGGNDFNPDEYLSSKGVDTSARSPFSNLAEGFKSVMKNPAYGFNPVSGGPIRAQNFASSLLGKGADFAQEELAKQGVDPLTQKVVSAPIRYGLDMATAAAPMGPGASEAAQDAGMKSLGFTKRFLKTPQMVDRARETAQILLDNGVITPGASAETMAQRAADLADQHGKAIGDYLSSVSERGKFFDPNEAISSLEQLRPEYRGGHFDPIHSKIDRAIETIKAVGPEPMDFQTANKLKGMLQDAANFNSNRDATLVDRVIAGKYRDALDTALSNVSNTPKNAEDYQSFLNSKKIYGAAQRVSDPLYNRLSSELGNRGISLTDFILASPQLAAGHPAAAAGMLGLKKVLEQLGPSTAAYVANGLKDMVSGTPGGLIQKGASMAAPLFQGSAQEINPGQVRRILGDAKTGIQNSLPTLPPTGPRRIFKDPADAADAFKGGRIKPGQQFGYPRPFSLKIDRSGGDPEATFASQEQLYDAIKAKRVRPGQRVSVDGNTYIVGGPFNVTRVMEQPDIASTRG